MSSSHRGTPPIRADTVLCSLSASITFWIRLEFSVLDVRCLDTSPNRIGVTWCYGKSTCCYEDLELLPQFISWTLINTRVEKLALAYDS